MPTAPDLAGAQEAFWSDDNTTSFGCGDSGSTLRPSQLTKLLTLSVRDSRHASVEAHFCFYPQSHSFSTQSLREGQNVAQPIH